jgi:glycosyltransferase involved in cell wall biosynthesis
MSRVDAPGAGVPTVSVIMPTYNRAAFLPRAFESIRAQTLKDWELIVVDDGSTDDTARRIQELSHGVTQPVRTHFQENAGPYAARNAGLDRARGRYIAFYDTDDVWLPHHLARCVGAMERDEAVGWVYGAVQRLDDQSGRVLTPHSFHDGDKPRPFLKLRTRNVGDLHVIDDHRLVAFALEYGLYCGLQNSVVRARVFDNLRFESCHRNEAEDQLVVARAADSGVVFGYFREVHLIYAVHEGNSSASALSIGLDRQVRVIRDQIDGFERYAANRGGGLALRERLALKRRLGRDYFWVLGYALFWENKRRREALAMFRKGLEKWPWNLAFWKTYLLSLARTAIRPSSNHEAC